MGNHTIKDLINVKFVVNQRFPVIVQGYVRARDSQGCNPSSSPGGDAIGNEYLKFAARLVFGCGGKAYVP